MDLSIFEDCLDRYGADLAKWPVETSGDAAALLARSAPARALHGALIEIEAILLADKPAAALADPIAARAMRHRQQRGLRPVVRRAAWAAAAAAALALGLFVGGVSPPVHDGSDRVMAAALDSLGSADVD